MDTAHRTIPEVAITTDLISGFPGETEQEFQDSLEFVRSAGFSGGHVFTYSPRPGTPAASMKDQVPRALAKVRSAILREVLAETAGQYRRKFLGQENTVLWEVCKREHNQDWMLEGLTPNGLRVCAFSAEAGHWNKIDRVRLLQENGDLLQAEIIPM